MQDLANVMGSLSPQELQGLRQDAAGLRREKRQQIQHAIAVQEARRQQLLMQEQDRQSDGLRNQVGSARLSHQSLARLAAMLDTHQYSSMRLRDGPGIGVAGSPAVPRPQEVDIFEAKVKEMLAQLPPSVSHPWWCKYVCPNRDRFHGVALAKVEDEDPEIWWLVLFCKQSPYQVTLLQLRRRPRQLCPRSEHNNEVFHGGAHGPKEFEYLPAIVKNEFEVSFSEDDDIVCLAGTRFREKSRAPPTMPSSSRCSCHV